MKKRLSLLMVLMMIVSLLPMSAFAGVSTSTSVQNVDVDKDFNMSVTYALDNDLTSNKTVEFKLVNGEFATTPNVKISVDGADQANVTTAGSDTIFWKTSADKVYTTAKINVKVTGAVKAVNDGEVALRVVEHNNSGIGSPADVVIAKASSVDKAALAITVDDSEKAVSFDGGNLSEFRIRNFKDLTTGTLEISMDDSDVTMTSAKVYIDGTLVTPSTILSAGVITLTYDASPTESLGEFNKDTTSIIVVPTVTVGRKAVEGPVKVLVEAKTGTKRTHYERATIGKLVDYAVTMTVVERSKKEIPNVWGGEEATVTVTLKGPKGSILSRPIDFTVDGADVKLTPSVTKPSGHGVTGTEDGKTGVYKDGEFSISTLPANIEEVKFDMVIKTDADKDGVATITAAQRGWEVTSDLAKVTPKIAIKADVTPIKKGEAKDTANVVITEAKAGLLGKNDKIQLTFDTKRDYVEFTTKSIKVEATNGMTFGDIVWGKVVTGQTYNNTTSKWEDKNETVKYVIEIPVNKTSSGEAAVITVSGLNVAVDGSTTDDVVKINAQLNGDTAAKADYIKVVKEYDMESILSVFTIGQTAYTVNGEAKAAHSAPYIKAGRTMLPIRAVAESLGLTVQWNSATRTASFTDASKVAAVTIGAKVMYVNGTPMPLTVPAELVNDTTFVELRSLATAFGVQIDWDAAAKTATVSK